MKHVILSEDRNGAGTIARVCRRPDGSYAVELVQYDAMGRLTVQSLVTESKHHGPVIGWWYRIETGRSKIWTSESHVQAAPGGSGPSNSDSEGGQ